MPPTSPPLYTGPVTAAQVRALLMVAAGQEKFGEKLFFQGQGKFGEFLF